jgi:hypothetical protein
MTDDRMARLSPLEMARDWANRVYAIAAHYEAREQADPGFGRIEAQVHQAGRQQFEAAQMASYMATVSLAEDLHRVVGVMLGDGWRDSSADDAVADARRTRDHMAAWAAGAEHHQGEQADP